ncbi:MAG TPA: peptidoglycan recognition family protein [Acidobacteriota bacterium]|nr:peptidoglycan recognition family protein [Acidobacteriota bacterium]
MEGIGYRIKFTDILIVVTAILVFPIAVYSANEIPQKYIGKWKGVSGKMQGADQGQTGTATTKRDLGHTITEFEFEVAADGKIQGTGKATHWFNVSAQADLIVTKVGPTAYLEGGQQNVDFKIEGTMTPEGKVKIHSIPQGTLTLINAGKRGTMDAWNVFGPYEHQIEQDGCRSIINVSDTIPGPPIRMSIEWKAERDCGVDCEVDRTEAATGQNRTASISRVIIHATGGLADDCDLSKSFRGGTLNSNVKHFQDSGGNPSIHYIVGEDGTVVRMVPDNQIANHIYRGNSNAIGIELINNGDGNDPYPLDQINALADLVGEILKCYSLDTNDVVGHGDVDTRLNTNCNPPRPRREDPASNFPWEVFRTRLDAILAAD